MFATQKLLVFAQSITRNSVKFFSSNAYKTVSYEILQNEYSGTAVVALNSPQNKNGLSKILVSEINEILDEIELNDSVRVLLVRSLVPGIFCAGIFIYTKANPIWKCLRCRLLEL